MLKQQQKLQIKLTCPNVEVFYFLKDLMVGSNRKKNFFFFFVCTTLNENEQPKASS